MLGSTGFDSGSISVLIYLNDLLSVCYFSELFLFADDTTVTAIDKQKQEFQIDLDSIGNWLKTNRLALNFEKTLQVNLISNTGLFFEIDGTQIESNPVRKYLGVYVVFKLCFNTYINPLEKLGKHSGIVSKLRHCVRRSQSKLFYETNIQPSIQYGALISVCCSYTRLLPIVKLQIKVVRLFTTKKRFSSVEDELMMYGILSVFELSLY